MTRVFTEVSDPSQLVSAPKVSVVVITYLHEDYLAQAVESIAHQKTSLPFEIIIAEDGSPDGTRDVALAMQKLYPSLVRVVFTSANKGMNANLKFALGLARSPYIAICEGDDFWIDAEKLERQVELLDRHPQVDLAFTRGQRLFLDGRREDAWDYGPVEKIISPRDLFAGFRWIAPTASLVWRAAVTKDLPPWFEQAPFGDILLIIMASARGGAIYEPRSTVAYRVAQPTSFSAGMGRAPARMALLPKAIRLIERACAESGMPTEVLAHRLNDYRLELSKLLINSGKLLAGLRILFTINPMFILRGAGRRVRRLVAGTSAETGSN